MKLKRSVNPFAVVKKKRKQRLKKLSLDRSTLTQYEQEDYTIASQELACVAGACEI
jgi:hypothetical protein